MQGQPVKQEKQNDSSVVYLQDDGKPGSEHLGYQEDLSDDQRLLLY